MDAPNQISWRDRAAALRNIPPVLRLLWESGRAVVAADVVLRVLTALLPVAILIVSQIIIDLVVGSIKNPAHPFPSSIWFWLTLEFVFACAGNLFGRAIGYFDSRLAD